MLGVPEDEPFCPLCLPRYIFKELVGFKKMNQDMVPSVGISE